MVTLRKCFLLCALKSGNFSQYIVIRIMIMMKYIMEHSFLVLMLSQSSICFIIQSSKAAKKNNKKTILYPEN